MHLSVRGKHLILSNIDLRINYGDFFYVVGKTGSGKSSLMRALYGDLPFHSGYCEVMNFDMMKIKTNQDSQIKKKNRHYFSGLSTAYR